jgi:ankyrin repeat protein
VDVVEILIKAGAETNAVIPPCYASPQHGQYPLAHACRQGHDKVAKLLLSNSEISQRKDQQNDFGWTALHECAFYNRAECVKLLLVYGCDGSLRTKRGLRAIDMTLSEEVQNLLLELVPEEERDTIVEKGKEARAKAKQQEQQQNQLRAHAARRGGQPSESKEAVLGERNGMHAAQNLVRDADDDDDDDSSCSDSGSDDGSEDDTSPTTNASAALHDQTNKKVSEGKQSDSYRLLGDLPDLAGGGAQQHKSKHGSSSTGNSKTRRGKKKGKRRSKQGTAGRVATPEKGVPSAFCCSLTGKLMSDPVRTPFGNHCYERDAVERWLKEQGNLDPVTGMPLATCELILDHPLRIQINDWQLQESLKGGGSSSGEQPDLCPKETAPMHAGKASKLKDAMGVSRSELDTSNDTTIPTGGGGGDDLYDF